MTTTEANRPSSTDEEVDIICSWCGEHLGRKVINIPEGMNTKPTHGMCERCARKFEQDPVLGGDE